MKVSVFNIAGAPTGKEVTLSDSIFNIEPNEHAVYLDVKQYLANQRQGTHKAKQRNEISGSTRKLHRQKGTGGSRKGSIKNPLFRGGGRVFGPVVRDYGFKLNKKVKALARKSALSVKAKADAIKVVENFSLAAPKTKDFISILNALALNNQKTLVVLGEHNPNLYLSSRNIPDAKVITVHELSTYELMNADALLLSEASIEVLEQIFKA